MGREAIRRSLVTSGSVKRMHIEDTLQRYVRNPETVIAEFEFERDNVPATVPMEDHFQTMQCLRRAENNLEEVRRKVDAISPSYGRLKRFIESSGGI